MTEVDAATGHRPLKNLRQPCKRIALGRRTLGPLAISHNASALMQRISRTYGDRVRCCWTL